MAAVSQPVGRRRGGARAFVCMALLASLSLGEARAAGFERLEVTEDSGTYRIAASIILDAPAGAVVGALLDFEGQSAITPPILETEILGATPDGERLVRIVSEICIGPFCRGVRQMQAVRHVAPGAVTSRVIADGGDLESGYTAVEVSEDRGRARVEMTCTLRPRRKRPFFIPKGWVLHAIRRQARQSADGLEALALKIASAMGSSR